MNKKDYSISPEYSIRKVTDLIEFEKLRTLWDNLANKRGPYMPFLCFDWFKIWLDHFLKGNKLLILLLYKGPELVTIAPCLIKEEKSKGINVRKIDLIGNVYSPFRYFVLSELNDEETVKSLSFILQFLSKTYRDWDVLDLNSIPEERNCFDVLKTAIKQGGMKYTDFLCYGDWYLDEINYSGDEYFNKNFTSKFRHNIKYRQRKLEEKGNLNFRIVKNEDSIDEHMRLYYELYSKSWQEREGVGPTFHLDLAKMASRHGWLRLAFLSLDSSAIASQFWVSCNGYAYILKTFYDQDYREYGPGKILTLHMMKYAMDVDKVKAVDYVQGDEPYKEDWTPKRRERKGILIYNNNIKGQSLALLNIRILPMLNKNKYLKKVKEIVAKRLG